MEDEQDTCGKKALLNVRFLKLIVIRSANYSDLPVHLRNYMKHLLQPGPFVNSVLPCLVSFNQ